MSPDRRDNGGGVGVVEEIQFVETRELFKPLHLHSSKALLHIILSSTKNTLILAFDICMFIYLCDVGGILVRRIMAFANLLFCIK